MIKTINRSPNFVRYACFVLAYVVGVILWGAIVRATGSGAGCGNHWPACNGEFIPRAENIETLIEFSHRLTSSISGVLIIILLIWAYRLNPARRFVRLMAILSFIFVVVEGGIGAALVRLELVENNASGLRAMVIALHLVNTLVLLTWLTLTAWGANVKQSIRLIAPTTVRIAVGVALFGVSIMSAAGAVTALGDTLFLSGVIGSNDAGAEHFLISLRAWHPYLGAGVSGYLFLMGYWILKSYKQSQIKRQAIWIVGFLALQGGVGILNIFLKAPVWMQVIHLFLADTIWILLILLSAKLMIIKSSIKPKAGHAT
ncbi:MAG: COX15/CtaA family protein [Chloroflexota bacterium]